MIMMNYERIHFLQRYAGRMIQQERIANMIATAGGCNDKCKTCVNKLFEQLSISGIILQGERKSKESIPTVKLKNVMMKNIF